MTTGKYVVALLIAFLVTAPAVAQQGSADLAERRLDMLDERLDLSDQQKARISEIWTLHREEMTAWADANAGATRAERRDYFRSRADDVHDAVNAVLTPEQVTRHDSLRQTRNARMLDGRRGAGLRGEQNGRRGGKGMRGQRDGRRDDRGMRGQRDGRGGNRGILRSGAGSGMRGGPDMFVERFAEALELSDAQRNEMQDIIESHQAEGSVWRDEHPEATREQRQAYHEGHFAQLKTELERVLTPDQLERFETLHEGRRTRMFQGRNRN